MKNILKGVFYGMCFMLGYFSYDIWAKRKDNAKPKEDSLVKAALYHAKLKSKGC